MKITCDAAATAAGYVREVTIEAGESVIEGRVKADADFSDTFCVWDYGEQELLRVDGWNCIVREGTQWE